MAKRTTEELTAALAAILGDRMTEDAAIALAEDIADSVINGDGEDWKKKYEDNDLAWRKRYTERFYSSGDEDEIEDKLEVKADEKDADDITVDDLFEERK